MEPSNRGRIQIRVDTSGKKAFARVACLSLVAIYLGLATAHFAATRLAANPSPASLSKAIRLDPWNDHYRDLAGQYYLFAERSPASALSFFNSALALNPRTARYWLDLAATDYELGKRQDAQVALSSALSVAPHTPSVAWEAANEYVSLNDLSPSLNAFRLAMTGDPSLQPAALEYCWRLHPDADELLRNVVPNDPEAIARFLELLTSRDEEVAATKAWDRLVELKQPVERKYVFGYAQYLINKHDFAKLGEVWSQSAQLADLAGYQPSTENLVVNGNFEFAILNAGLDWRYEKSSDVTLTLDPDQSQSGGRSLKLNFDSQGMQDVGIRQFIPVQPSTHYVFSGKFRSEKLQGAGGPEFAIEDFVTGVTYFSSEYLKSDDFWSRTQGEFVTGPDTQLLVLRLVRVPAGNAIRGKLWIDEVRLVPGSSTFEAKP